MRRLIIIAIILLLTPLCSACKDVIVMNGNTAGDYSLFMKVRDPSRPGLQVIFMVGKGFEYSYQQPWRRYEVPYTVQHKLLCAATIGDTPPNIIKAGMLLSDSGIAYGDADSPNYWINPTRRAWDDFDWLRYAAQTANTTDQAVTLLEDVTEMHAPGIGENLFVVNYNNAYVIEADAVHFISEPVEHIVAMSNYPERLWYTRWLKRVLISPNFDRVFEGEVHQGQVVRLGGLCGIKITDIGLESIVVRPVPGLERVEIQKNNGACIGPFYVSLNEINGRTARIKMCYEYNAWQQQVTKKLMDIPNRVTITDLINLSRLHDTDLNGLRGFCENEKKATMIFKLPRQKELSMAWFAPDQCCSIYIPVHICDTNICTYYQNGDAAEIALGILKKFGHGGFNPYNIERVFLFENERIENLALTNPEKASAILTSTDVEMQHQAILMQQIALEANNDELSNIMNLWSADYFKTLCNMEKNLSRFSENTQENLALTALSMGRARADVEIMINGSNVYSVYEQAESLIEKGSYRKGITIIKNMFEQTDKSLFGLSHESQEETNELLLMGAVLALVMALVLILIKGRRKHIQ